MEWSARFVAAPLLRHLAAAELSENRDQLFVAVEPIDTYAVVGVGVFRDTSDDVAQRQPDNYAYGNAPHHDASPPIKQTFAPPDQTNSARLTHHGRVAHKWQGSPNKHSAAGSTSPKSGSQFGLQVPIVARIVQLLQR